MPGNNGCAVASPPPSHCSRKPRNLGHLVRKVALGYQKSSGPPSSSRSSSSSDVPFAPAYTSSSSASISCSDVGTTAPPSCTLVVQNISSSIAFLQNAYDDLTVSPIRPLCLDATCNADRAISAQFKRLSELNLQYKGLDPAVAAASVFNSCSTLQQANESRETQRKDAVIKSYEEIIESFHFELQAKDVEIEKLKDMLARTTLEKEKLEKKMSSLLLLKDDYTQPAPLQIDPTLSCAAVNPSLDPASFPSSLLLVSAAEFAFEEVRKFAKVLSSLMVAAKWDMAAAVNSIVPGIEFTKVSHSKYAFESYICQRMMNGFEEKSFNSSCDTSCFPSDKATTRLGFYSQYKEMKSVDPSELIHSNPNGLFGRFSQRKFLEVVHPNMEESFFRSLDNRRKLENGLHPGTHFYHKFLNLAKALWILHRLALSFEPTVSAFEAVRGSEFLPSFMTSIVHPEGLENSKQLHKVGFTVMPGLELPDTVFKCQVYVVPDS